MCYTIIGLHIAFGQGTPTTTAGNLDFLPQKAYVYTLPPDGVSQPQQSGFSTDGSMIGTIMGVIGTGVGIYTKYQSDKNKKNVQEVAQTQVKIADAQQSLAQQTYENMPDKGESIKDKPKIQIRELEKTVDKAIETASKA